MFSLANKVALITGGSGGIGSAIARAFHAAGATVIIHNRSEEPLLPLKAELGERVFTAVAELSDPAASAQLVKDCEAMAGRVDILINNAGLTADTLAMRMKDEDWDKVIAVNLSACFRLSRECLPAMMKARWGRIINMASIVGVMGNAGQANYAASKGGLIAMGKTIAAEVASRGVTVNAIAPGFIETPMTEVLPEAVKAAMMATIPMGRFGLPADIAAAALFLASEEAGYITGQTLHINGGQLRV